MLGPECVERDGLLSVRYLSVDVKGFHYTMSATKDGLVFRSELQRLCRLSGKRKEVRKKTARISGLSQKAPTSRLKSRNRHDSC